MLWRRHTDEFSIILLLDDKAAGDIQKIRSQLPPSPYRDDRPHATLLRGVRTPYPMGDKQLFDKLQPVMDALIHKNQPHARVRGLSNVPGGYYRRTSAIVLVSDQMRHEHLNLLKSLEAGGFKISRSEKHFYPHATIRLGVPLNHAVLRQARGYFPEHREVNFNGWIVQRLISKQGKRLFYEVRL